MLALLGFIYALVGVAYLLMPWTDIQRETLQVALVLGPQPVWGLTWLALGWLALICAVLARTNQRADLIGYNCLAGLSTCWCAIYLIGGVMGAERAWLGAAVWAAMTGMLLIVAGWPEQPSHHDDP